MDQEEKKQIEENARNIAILLERVNQRDEIVRLFMSDIKSTIKDIHDKLDNRYVTRRNFDQLEKDVTKIQSSITWLVRTMIGAMVTSVLAFIGFNF
jgi:hypothetical protein